MSLYFIFFNYKLKGLTRLIDLHYPQDTLDARYLHVPKGAGAEDGAAAARLAGCGGGVPGGVVSIPLSSIIFLQLQYTVKKKNVINIRVIKSIFLKLV